MPDVQGTEVGANGIWIAYALQDSDFPLVVHILYGCHGRVEPYLVIDRQDIFRLDFQYLAVVLIQRVTIGYEGVQGVVGPGHLEDYQDWVFLVGGHYFLLSELDCYV